jgi:hypothetical protein
MFVPAVNDKEPFNTGNYHSLRKLAEVNGGRLLAPPTLSEVVEKAGLRFVAVSSGSTGSAFLLNPESVQGTGILINGGFEPGKTVAFPEKINQAVLPRFGSVKADSGFLSLEWTERVVRDYVLPELRPNVMIDWITEPDGTQHEHGAGSPEGTAILRKVDAQIGMMLDRLRELELDDETNIIVTPDHGFSYEPESANLAAVIQKAGMSPGDVVVANNGESALFFVNGHDAGSIKKLATHLQSEPTVGAVFTRAQQP